MTRYLASLLGGVFMVWTSCAKAGLVAFDAKERDWIAQNPVLYVGVAEDLHPLEYMEKENVYGQSVLYLGYLAEVAGLKLKYVPFKNLAARRGALVEGHVNLLSTYMQFSSESLDPALKYLVYHRTSLIVVTRVGGGDVFSLDQLQGKRVMVPGVEYYERLFDRRDNQAILIKSTSALDMLESVTNGRADAAVATETFFMPYLYSRFRGELEISGVLGGELLDVGMAVRAEDAVLISIVRKALGSITPDQRKSLYAQWYRQLKVNPPTLGSVGEHYFHVLALVILAFLAICLLVLRGIYNWHREVRSEHEKSMLLRVISEELRSPINDIMAEMNRLLSTGLSEQQRHLASLAIGSVASLRGVLDEGLNILETPRTRPKQQPCEPTDINKLIAEVIELHRLCAQQKKLELKLDVPSGLPKLLIDGSRLTQLLHNFISNAIKFTHVGGVSVSAMLVWSERDVQLLNIEIRDTGEGVPESVLASLFQPFAQARHADQKNGTGLGLMICQQLVESMGGSISFVSEQKVGTTVTLSLPTPFSGEQREGPESDIGIAASTSQALPRILVVEDSWANQEALHEQIVSLGCRPIVAGEARQAKELFSDESPDLILMDCDLPDQDGYSLTRELRIAESRLGRPRCPIIAISSFIGEQHAQRCSVAGMDALLSKPIRLKELKDVIEYWCQVSLKMSSLVTITPAKPSSEALEEMHNDLSGLIKAVAICDRPTALHLAHRLHGAALIMKWSALSEKTGEMEMVLGQESHWDDPAYAMSLQALIRQWQVSSERLLLDNLPLPSFSRKSLQ